MTTSTPESPAETSPQPFQFRIRDLLLVMLLVGLAVGAVAQGSPELFLIFLLTGACCAYLWRELWMPRNPVPAIVTLGLIFLVLAGLMLPSVQTTRTPSVRGMCGNNLLQIVLALENYHDVYGSFPPAYVADESGRPMHSWRVLLLPFIEHEDLYKQYRFDEPWDGPNNRQLARSISRVYACPADHRDGRPETSYVAIIGPHTAWPGDRPVRRADMKDGPSNVLLVFEVKDSGIHWMEPRDLHVNQMAPAINAPHGQGVSSKHPGCAQAAFADGRVRQLPDNLPPSYLRSWMQIDDDTLGEPP
ncbi:MAG TPA: DUF1559 domain-containing protein [Pirellulaceae bacterium]|nr:DUF1559 domain-containing protein [Pirellulaceae bacterium]